MSEVVNHLIAQVRKFLQTWEPEVLKLPSQLTDIYSKGDRKQEDLRQQSEGVRVVYVPSVNRVFLLKESALLRMEKMC